jgi:ArsR family transcriptional regulator
LALEQQELAVTDLRTALQLPQSTVSRHLKVLADEGWITSRANGTSNWYRMAGRELDPGARRLWSVVKEQFGGTPAAVRDAERIKSVLSERHGRSQAFFATSAGQWDKLRADLFGTGIEWLALAGLLGIDWVVGDLGAGTGQLSANLAPMIGRVIAVDESAAMLKSLTDRVQDLPNVEVRQGALESLPIENNYLDLAMVVLVLHHVADPALAMAEVSRVVKPGGRVIIADMMPHERTEYRESMGHQWLGFDRHAVDAWCQSAGLAGLTYRPLPPQSNTKGPLLFVASAEKRH